MSTPTNPPSEPSVENATMPAAVMAMPAPLTSRMPYRSESGAARAEIGIITNVRGSSTTAAFRAL